MRKGIHPIVVAEGFRGGLNTASPPTQLRPDELRIATNVDLLDSGHLDTPGGDHYFNSQVLPYELYKINFWNYQGTRYVIAQCFAAMDALYWAKQTNATDDTWGGWNTLVAYGYKVKSLTAAETANLAGAEMAPSTTYEYAIVGFGNGGDSTISDVVEIATSNPAKQIEVEGRGVVFSFQGYDLYRRVKGTSQWYKVYPDTQTIYTKTTAEGVQTFVKLLDDGSSAGARSTPNNLGKITITGLAVGDFANTDEACYYKNDGMFIKITVDGSGNLVGNVVEPSDYDVSYGPNELHDKDSPPVRARKLRIHKNYFFMLDSPVEPGTLYYSLLDRPAYVPATAYMTTPDQRGGSIVNAAIVSDVLSVQSTASAWTLHGSDFTPDSANFDGYWNMVSNVGCGAKESVTVAPIAGKDMVIYLTPFREHTNVVGIVADSYVSSKWNAFLLATKISRKFNAYGQNDNPYMTSDDTTYALSDITQLHWEKAVSYFYKGRILVSFPDKRWVFIGHPGKGKDGETIWFGPIIYGYGIKSFTVTDQGVLLVGCTDKYVRRFFYFNKGTTTETARIRTRTVRSPIGQRAVKAIRLAYGRTLSSTIGVSTPSGQISLYADNVLVGTGSFDSLAGTDANPDETTTKEFKLRTRAAHTYCEIVFRGDSEARIIGVYEVAFDKLFK